MGLMRQRLVVFIVAVAFGATGCVGEGGTSTRPVGPGPDGESSTSSGGSPAAVSDVSAPDAGSEDSSAEASLLSLTGLSQLADDEEILVWRAVQRLVSRCMQRKGFAYVEIPLDNVAQNRTQATMIDRLDLVIAESVGYHTWLFEGDPRIAADLGPFLAAGAANEAEAAANPDFLLALDGPTDDKESGCTFEAYRLMYGERRPTSEIASDVVNELRVSVTASVQSDPRYREALGVWQNCVREAGYEALDPVEMSQPYLQNTTITEAEKSAAIADSRCRASANIYSVSRVVEHELILAFFEARPGLLEELAEARLEDVNSAKAVLNDSA
jgi:hypothetical protein